MKNNRFARLAAALLCVLAVTVLFPVTVCADTGPKPSVRVLFENLGDELCYGTLLSSKESTGPSSAWDGTDGDARHNENPNGHYSYQPFGYDVWKAFVEFAEKDDFYFLQEAWQINETKALAWTYYPPNEFKILLYFPNTGEYAVSGVYEKYAFDTYYTVDMNGVSIGSVEYNGSLSTDERLQAYRSYNYRVEMLSLLARILLTIAVEMGVALLFGFRKKQQIWLLLGVNTVTQVLLNLLLNLINYRSGEMAFVAYYVLLELLVFALEAVVYCVWINKHTETPRRTWICVVYSLAANGVSFGVGLMAAQLIPGIF